MNGTKQHNENFIFPDGGTVGDFTIISAIGSGAYGEVYYVSDPLGAKFALKVIKEQISEVSAREISGISLLRTQVRAEESLPQIYHVGKLNDLFYYTMDAADDSKDNPDRYTPDTLQHRLDKGEKFSAAETLEIAGALLKSLSALHSRNLVHRDIKPSNIIFLDGKCMLTDFGLISENPKTFVGSPGFLAPFPAGGITLQNQKEADLYSLGKVIYCMFSGEPAERFPLLPENFSVEEFSVIRPLYQKACAVDPQKRFKSCEEFSAAIEQSQKRNPSKLSKRSVMIAAAISLLLLAVIFAVVFTRFLSGDAGHPSSETVEKVPSDDAGSEAVVKVWKRNGGYQILVCFTAVSADEADPFYRPNQFKAMSFVKMGMADYLQLKKSQQLKINSIRYLKQPSKEENLLVYIYFIAEKDFRVINKQLP